jgi:prevent-host-death family protein
MRTVNLTELRTHFSAYLRSVHSGEEVIVTTRGVPIARIRPVPASISEGERQLVAASILKLPEEEVTDWGKFWDDFFALAAPGISEQEAIRAVLEEREESW